MHTNVIFRYGGLILFFWQIKSFVTLFPIQLMSFCLFNENDSTSHSLLWEVLKSYLRGQIIYYSALSDRKCHAKVAELTPASSNIDKRYALNPSPELFKQRMEDWTIRTRFNHNSRS